MDFIRIFLDMGNALRLKLGSNKKYKVEEMAEAISSIKHYNINGKTIILETDDDSVTENDFVSLIAEEKKVTKFKSRLGLFGIAKKRFPNSKLIEVIIPFNMEVSNER